jgi:pyruvate/2-oxoglutarate dehydrogenase complex dihydrolipoamide dehydrogenase (E3) component
MSRAEPEPELLARVHPPGWPNPTPSGRYNLVVIGAGTAGLVAAAGAAGLGAKVALVERSLLGGDCLNHGCVPSKALLRSARAAAEVRDAEPLGIAVPPGARADFEAVMRRMRGLRVRLAEHDSAQRFAGLGVDVYLGAARFTGPESVEVEGKSLRFARACIATGARPAVPDVPGLAEAGFLTNENVFSLEQLPRRLAVLGPGPIGCELAQCFARLGSEVTLLARGTGILPREDRDAARPVADSLVHDGIALLTETSLLRVERTPSGRSLVLRQRGAERRLEVDELLVAVGRAPNVQGLGLDAAGVRHDAERGVLVDDRLRTSNRRVFAAGDVCSQHKFTHAADAMARIVIRNALFFGRQRVSRLVVPWCTYTDPELAHVGLHEHEAGERGLATRTITVDLERVDRAVLDGERGLLRVLLPARGDRILGASLVSRHAGETIAELAGAIVHGIGLSALGSVVHPYPTVSEAIRRAADACARERLTPRVRSLFGRLLAWRRR